jgi:hypothetical protein
MPTSMQGRDGNTYSVEFKVEPGKFNGKTREEIVN